LSRGEEKFLHDYSGVVPWLYPSHFGSLAAEVRMTRKALLRLLGLAILVLAVFAIYLIWAGPRHHIDAAGYERIKTGMSLEQVEAILGVPEGDYSTLGLTQKSEINLSWLAIGQGRDIMLGRTETSQWSSNFAAIRVDFKDGHVRHARFVKLTPSFGATVRRWIRVN
jgi:hypothetical protein